MADSTANRAKRPLSPHLSIYRLPMTAWLSITHRITGVALYAGLLLLIVFLFVVAYHPEYYGKLYECLSSFCGRLCLFGWTLAFFIHFFNGFRHLLWDTGKGLDIPTASRTSVFVIVAAVAATLSSWAVAYHNLGAL